MSEKIYALLLRLYPSHFREAYGDEALQLFRDRARDERGLFSTVQLWFDLLADLAISGLRGHGQVQPEVVGASAEQYLGGIPSFRVLEGGSPRRGALLLGGLLSLLTLAAFPVSISRFGSYVPAGAWAFRSLRPSSDAAPNDSRPQPNPQDAPGAMTQAGGERAKLDAPERQRVIHAVIANLKEHYIDPAVAHKIAEALPAHERNGDYDAVTDGPAFAGLITAQLRDVSQDMHLDVIYSRNPLPDRPPAPTPEGSARYRQAMEQDNCTFEKVEILPHHIGYLKLNSFPDPSVCRSTALAAMASLNHADAIIFDLRDNGGGYPGMVMLITAYLFDHPEYVYNPRENTTHQSWTQSPVPGNRLADKPVYLLTSARTASGAEQFAYNLKMLKRATLVGDTTRGSAHSGVFHRIDEHFGMGIPEVRPINPFSSRDWEGTGVEADVRVEAADALERATKLAESKTLK
jgi:Peptidase family S41/N-terminal domain of Peptidase_S41 in eukaryotic IRBP